jgi:hypothetical protein
MTLARKGLALALGLGLAGAARADMTAKYAAPHMPVATVVEIASNGDVRAEHAYSTHYSLTRDGHDYVVLREASGPFVARIEDLSAAVTQDGGAFLQTMCELVRKQPSGDQVVAGGPATIAGRTGDSFLAVSAKGEKSDKPLLVVSRDPELEPLRRAMLRQFEAGVAMLGCLAASPTVAHVRKAIEGGAPILFDGAELTGLDKAPIDPARFALPAPPASLAEVRKRVAAGAFR